MASSSTLRAFLSRVLGISAPGGVWRLIALFLAIINFKNLPFMWHIRLFRGLIYQLYLQPTPLPQRALFQPIVTSTRSPLAECDYNLHKSNSTYFSDLDISRTHLVTALLRQGIRRINDPQHKNAAGGEHPKEGNFAIALGGITCHFRREVAPYARFEIWTRLLCWDRKWLYLVSHLVRPGVATPAAYTLQPWRKGGGDKQKSNHSDDMTEEEERQKRRKDLSGAVYATSIAKYVVKKGRWTVPAEQALLNSGVLPGPRPAELGSLDGNGGAPPPPVVAAAAAAAATANGDVDGSYVLPALAPRRDGEGDGGDGELTWHEIEAERQRGMKLAELFAGLDEAHFEFTGGQDGVLGEYADMLTPFW
ncbi:hypothetical protein SLS55_006209 [Diplodia seriata]|uniref:Capsule polysaccharide biosynthesis protein n=1 Tax=Diplodia seriata TaxID=420778 RepID=A0A1S8BCT4_9PEZI|nr:hypothetical protein BK809_0004000 [Diplodia seriata]